MSDDVRYCQLLVQRLSEALELFDHQRRAFAAEMEAIRTQWRDNAGKQIDRQFLGPISELRERAAEMHRGHQNLLTRVSTKAAQAEEFHREILARSETMRSLIQQATWELGEAEAELDQVSGAESASCGLMQEASDLLARIGS
jgi:hypothetical protein